MAALKQGAPARNVSEVGQGDFVKVRGHFYEIANNTAHGAEHTPRNWTITTTTGESFDMWSVERYAKAEDMA